MSASPFLPHSLDVLPTEIALFPLTGALLLPAGHLPLNIFEPRYVSMVTDALMTPQRFIGMVQASDPEASMGEAPIHPIGCAGRLSSYSENENGTILITLTGVVRFEVSEELSLAPGGYRRAAVNYSNFAADLIPADDPDEHDILRASIIDATRRYFEAKGFNTDWDNISELDLPQLITSLGMACPFDPLEKQALLEAGSLEERAKALTQIMTMATLGDSVSEQSALN